MNADTPRPKAGSSSSGASFPVRAILCALATAGSLMLPSSAEEHAVTLREWQSTDYQIVLPEKFETVALEACAKEEARLIQAAYLSAGAWIPITTESALHPSKPALFLGATRFAAEHGVHFKGEDEWAYEIREQDGNVIIAGNDHPSRVPAPAGGRAPWDRYATAKGVADFARAYLGV